MKAILKKGGFVFAFLLIASVFYNVNTADAAIAVPALTSNNASSMASTHIDISTDKNQKSVVPITVRQTGSLMIYFKATTTVESISVKVTTDASGDYPINGCDEWVSAGLEAGKVITLGVLTPGTYYLAVQHNYDAALPGSIDIVPYQYSRSARTMTAGKQIAVPPCEPSYSTTAYSYFKISTAKGYIGVDQQNTAGDSMDVALCRSNKTEIEHCYLQNGRYYYPVSKGTYYLRTKGVSGAWGRLRYVYTSAFTLKNGAQNTVNIFGSGTYDFRFKAEKTGVITIYNTATYGSYLHFLSSKKVPLVTYKPYVSSGYVSYAVKKGTTYYIRATGTIGNQIQLRYVLSAKSTKNTSKKKATLIKKGKTVTSLFVAGKKTTCWVKFKLKKKQKLNLKASGGGSLNFLVSLYKGSAKKSIYGGISYKKYYTYDKLPKGTYYVRLKQTTKGSGYINLSL